MSLKSTSTSLRRPSPVREPAIEETFKAKLDEIKRRRQENLLNKANEEGDPIIKKKKAKRLIINGKPVEKRLGRWAKMRSSKGKPYYFDLKTQKSQWVEPPEWTRLEAEEEQAVKEEARREKEAKEERARNKFRAIQEQQQKQHVEEQVPQRRPPEPPKRPPSPPPPLPEPSFQMKIKTKRPVKGAKQEDKDKEPVFEAVAPSPPPKKELSLVPMKSLVKEEVKAEPVLNIAEAKERVEEQPKTEEKKKEEEEANGDKEKKGKDGKKKQIRKRRTSSSSSSRSSRSRSRSRSRGRSRSRSRKRSKKGKKKSRSYSRSRSRSSSSSRSRSRSRGKRRSSRSRSPRRRSHSRSRSPRRKNPASAVSPPLPSAVPSLAANAKHLGLVTSIPGIEGSFPIHIGGGGVPGASQGPDMSAVLAAKAKIESQMQAAGIVTPKVVEPMALPTSLPVEKVSTGPLQMGSSVGITWVSEYNLPALLSRCKFPKVADALHELRTNSKKLRNFTPEPLPPDAENIPSISGNLRRDIFVTRMKYPLNRHRLLSEKLGQTVYKISDEEWEKNFHAFQIELVPGVRLECRPHGFTEDDTPVYTRTGKVAMSTPFQEDIVRCHSVLQAWSTQLCHCVYANRIFLIERDDNQWKADLDECKKFLSENGY